MNTPQLDITRQPSAINTTASVNGLSHEVPKLGGGVSNSTA